MWLSAWKEGDRAERSDRLLLRRHQRHRRRAAVPLSIAEVLVIEQVQRGGCRADAEADNATESEGARSEGGRAVGSARGAQAGRRARALEGGDAATLD